tara:strand:+ start:63 stop:470 length:408 start_codon:yes stop_codon:yes gene_type:complete
MSAIQEKKKKKKIKGVRKPLSIRKLSKRNKSPTTINKKSMIKELSDDPFRERNTSGPDLKGLTNLFKKDKTFKSITGSRVGTADAFRNENRAIPDYNYDTLNDSIDSWKKHGGSIKKSMKKRPANKGRRKELRGS